MQNNCYSVRKRLKLFPVLFLFITFFVTAQTHRFIYEVNYKKDSTENILTKAFYHLDINPDKIEYYGRDYYIMDSLRDNNIPLTQEMNVQFSNIEIHDKNSQNYETYEMLEYDMIMLKSTAKQNWKLSAENKTLGQYNVQRGETHWGGRNWVAWFATEIPFSEGPYKFNGLPGIIMELYDTNDNFNFRLIKSQNFRETVKSPVPTIFTSKAPSVSKEKYHKTKLMLYNDPLTFLKNMDMKFTPDNWVELKDGTKVTMTNQKQVIINQQKLLKKYNNPIELDQAVKYPLNN